MTDDLIIKKFIEVGKELDENLFSKTALIEGLKGHAEINIIGPTECKTIACRISINDLCYLIKAMVLSEVRFNWVGGSAASSIWLFRELQSKDFHESINLANWILPRTTNYYVPFGFKHHGAETYADYIKINEKMDEQIKRSLIEIEKSENRAALEREKSYAQRKLSALNRKSEERKLLIEKLNKLSIIEQMGLLVQDDKNAIGFYPTSLADKCSNEIISTFDDDLRFKLFVKLKGKHKGPWGNFKKRLNLCMTKERSPMKNLWDRKPWHLF